MKIKQAKFLGSFPNETQCPDSPLPEFAFVGRSNVGKSSLINALCGRKTLAKTSATPGKTQSINLFRIDDQWQLADLPGYGYAKISKKIRNQFEQMIRSYLLNRKNLFCAFSLIDIRIPPQKIDLAMIEWMGEHAIPFYIIFTKTDKLKPSELEAQIERFKNTLLQTWEELPFMFASSSKNLTGKDEILTFIESSFK